MTDDKKKANKDGQEVTKLDDDQLNDVVGAQRPGGGNQDDAIEMDGRDWSNLKAYGRLDPFGP
jgi:hypothetical protein